MRSPQPLVRVAVPSHSADAVISATGSTWADRLPAIVVAAALGWGVFAFGAVHPWASLPLVAGVSCAGAWMWMRHPSAATQRLGIAALALLAPIALQLVPLDAGTLASIAPANDRLLDVSQVGRGLDERRHALSVAPELTTAALVFLAAGILWTAGLARAIGGRSLMTASAVVMWLGLLVAVFALVQKATFNGKIYWVWESEFRFAANYYGPFVNRNHFAGWMLLALALTLGRVLGLIEAARADMGTGWRKRVLWLGTPQASAVLLALTAALVMAVSLVWSLSRSGIAGLGLAVTVLTTAALLRFRGGTVRVAAIAIIVSLFASAVTWKGVEALASWYENTHTLEWRFALWRDSMAPLRDFMLLGSGLNTYGRVMLVYPQTDATVHAQQAHNDYLQLAVEGGALVLVAWTIAALLLARCIAARVRAPQDDYTWWVRMGAVAGIAGMALQELSEFSLQIPAVSLLFATALAIAIHAPQRIEAGRRSGRVQRPGIRTDEPAVGSGPRRLDPARAPRSLSRVY